MQYIAEESTKTEEYKSLIKTLQEEKEVPKRLCYY
jgi:hypothetical protein